MHYNTGRKHTEETKQKIRSKLMGRKLSAEHKENIKLNNPKYWLGKKRSFEDIEKFRTSHLGKIPWNKGLKLDKLSLENAASCKEEKDSPYKIHWANISGKYLRDINDWKRLCVSCHLEFDKERRKIARIKNNLKNQTHGN